MQIDNLKVKTYIEDEYKLAYAKARKELGHNLVIIEKKEVVEGGVFGLFGKKRVRVTFGVELVKNEKKAKSNPVSKDDSDIIKALRDVAVKHMNELKDEKQEKEVVESFKPLAQELFNIESDYNKESVGVYTPFKKEQKKSFDEIQKELKLSAVKPKEEVQFAPIIPKMESQQDQLEKLRRELQKELKNTAPKKEIKVSKNSDSDFVDFLRDNEFEKALAIEIDEFFDEKDYDRVNYKDGLKEFFKQYIKVKHEENEKKICNAYWPYRSRENNNLCKNCSK